MTTAAAPPDNESPTTLAGHRLDVLSDLLARRTDLHTMPLLGVVLAEAARESA
jgi:hypothetical protein